MPIRSFRCCRSLLCVLHSLLILSCNKQGESQINILNADEEKVGKWIYFDSLEIDTVKIEFYTDNSVLLREINFQKGKRIFDTYYDNEKLSKVIRFNTDNGSIKSITKYDRGKKTHKKTWHSNGNLYVVANYSGVDLIGEFRQYYFNGKLEFKIDDVKNGQATLYDSLGNRQVLLQFENYQSVDTLEIY